MSDEANNNHGRESSTPLADALRQILERKAARPQDVYRLAVIVEAILDAQDDPDALLTIRGELRELLHDLSQAMPDSTS